jgi:hypothetical protein
VHGRQQADPGTVDQQRRLGWPGGAHARDDTARRDAGAPDSAAERVQDQPARRIERGAGISSAVIAQENSLRRRVYEVIAVPPMVSAHYFHPAVDGDERHNNH